MKTRENTSDDLWTQRSLSSFQTFAARNQQENNKNGNGDQFDKTSPGSANSVNGNGSLNGFHYNEHSILSSSSSGSGSSAGSAAMNTNANGNKHTPPGCVNTSLVTASTLPRLNGRGNHGSSYCYINGNQEIIPLSVPVTPMSEFSADSINGNGNSNNRPQYQKHQHHGTFPKALKANGGITGNSLSRAKPVPIPMLFDNHTGTPGKQCNIMTNGSLSKKDRNKYIHSRSLSHEDHTKPFAFNNQLSVMPPTTTNLTQQQQQPLTAPSTYLIQHSHSHSYSNSYTSTSTTSDSVTTAETEIYHPHAAEVYIPDENDVMVLEFEIKLGDSERRFGFSVIGGMDEGFPPCIDEVSPGSPADKADLEVGDEILEVNGRSLEDATHTEVISHIHQCIRSRTICLRVKRRSGNKLALDLASQSNVQDAFVIAVEQQARERLEKLSALKRIKPVDMTKLSQQLSEVPSGSGDTAELNGLIEAATGSPIYVTSVPELSSSQVALHRAIGSGGGGGGSELTRQDKRPSLQSTSPISGLSVSAANNSVSSGGSKSTSAVLSNKSPVLISNGVRQKTSAIQSSAQDRLKSTPTAQQQLSSGPSSSQSVPNRVGVADKPRTSQIKPPYKETAIITSKPTSLENITGSQESIEGAKSTRSGVGGRSTSKSSSRESVVDQSQSQYANMINMVEWSNEGREMAVDVPDTFIPRNKTPPRYPPTSSAKAATLTSSAGLSAGVVSNKIGHSGLSSRNSAGGVPVMTGNGSSTLPTSNGAAGKPIPPPRITDKDSWANNNNTTITAAGGTIAAPPHVLPRTILSPNKTTPDLIAPSTDQADRIRKYQEELKKRREQEELHAKEQEFLRTSLRGSKKLQQLESLRNEQTPSPQVLGFVNDAYETVSDDYISPAYVSHQELFLKKPVGISELVASLQRVQEALKKNGMHLEETVSAVGVLMQSPDFQQVLAVHNKVQDVWCFNSPPTPISAHSQQFVQECLGSLCNCSVPEAIELVDILSRVTVEGLLYAHDKIAERERLLLSTETPLNFGESVDDFTAPRPAFVPDHQQLHQPDDHIKVVRIEKTQDPLGATVRNEGDAVVIGRIVKGGAAERSGLLHEGDEVLEVNGIEMRGKTVNEVCDILSRMTGTLTFLIVPSSNPPPPPQRRDVLVHVRAFFDYDPEDDIYVPCRELGIAFSKGDVLHVISQDDANWWQAHREGEEDQALAGLIPSKSFQEQREAVKQSLLGETESREKQKRGTLLCAKTHKKKKKKIPYSTAFNDDFDAEEIPTYEEVALYYPRTSFKRPVVLIGPPNIGRHELRQRLMQESERFAAAVPHTSRTRKDGELDGQDYHFITRAQFEADILARKFVEHGEFEKAYYGTSLDAIRSVVNIGKICVLNLHPQSLKILRNSDLKPYIVFIAPPPLERLKQMRISRGEAYKEDELIDIIEKAREMEDKYGHYFDLVIINNDIERTYYELVQRINYIEREPQWVPKDWISKESTKDFVITE